MPIVPRRQGPIETAPLPGVRLSPQAPEAAFGVPGNGVDVTSPLAGVVAPMVQKARRDADQIAALDSDNQIAKLSTDLETRALSRQGKNALDNADVFTDFDKGAGEIENGLASDDQKMAFRRAADARRQSLYASVERHAATQHEAYDRDTTASALDLRTDTALKNYDDPGIRQQSMDETRAIIKDFGARQGWSPETIDEKVATQLSRMHSSVMREFADAKQLPEAVQYYEDHKDEFVGEDAVKASALASAARVQNDGDTAARAILSGGGAGMLERGNIDLTKRPQVRNPDGTTSTVRSISIGEDGQTVLIPTVVDGKVVSDDAAVAQYKKTGEHLGKFADETSADAYAQRLHQSQADMIAGRGTGTVSVSPTDAFAQAEAIADPNVRKIATEAVLQHFNNLDRLQRIEREDARARVINDLTENGGRLNTASSDWQTIKGYPEGEHVLDVQRDILHPKDPGDPDKFASYQAMSATSPATRQALANISVADVLADKTMSGGQKSAVINLIRGAQREARATELTDVRARKTDLDKSIRDMQRTLKTRTDDEGNTLSDDAIKQMHDDLLDAQARAMVLNAQENQLRHGDVLIGAPHADAATSTRTPATTSTMSTTNAFGLSAAKPVTPGMLEDIRRKGEGYANYLRQNGYAVPAVVPVPQPVTQPTASQPTTKPTAAPRPAPAPAATPAPVRLEPTRPTGTAPNVPSSGLAVPPIGTPYEKNGHTVIDTPRKDSAGHVPTHRLDQPTNRQPNETWTQYEDRVLGERSKPADTAVKSELTALEPDVRDAAVRMIADAKRAGIQLETKETLRSQARQEALFREGRAPGSKGSPVTWTLTSDHSTGRAIDFDGNDKAIAWLQQNAPRYGFTTLGDMDPGHVSMPKGTAKVNVQ
jgi:hypothetical protein